MIRGLRSTSDLARGLLAASAAALVLATYTTTFAADSQPDDDREMKTRAVVQRYFDALGRGDDWAAWFADDMAFTSFTSPVKQVNGKAAYLQATQRFYGSVRKVHLRQLLIEGDRGCALTRYELQPPNGAPTFTSDVAELFEVRDGKIESLEIYFDSAPFPK